jgi:nitrite reductase/ring-hydroxylating ferredoxin subunit
MRLSALNDIADGGFAEVEATIDGDAESLVLYRLGDEVRAWLNVCPHAGRRLDWAPGQFLKSKDGHLVCAAHGASFELDRAPCRCRCAMARCGWPEGRAPVSADALHDSRGERMSARASGVASRWR